MCLAAVFNSRAGYHLVNYHATPDHCHRSNIFTVCKVALHAPSFLFRLSIINFLLRQPKLPASGRSNRSPGMHTVRQAVAECAPWQTSNSGWLPLPQKYQ